MSNGGTITGSINFKDVGKSKAGFARNGHEHRQKPLQLL
jgi:hypothetical protein